MLSTLLLCNAAFCFAPLPEPMVDAASVSVFEIVETRRAKLKPAKNEGMRFGSDQAGTKLVLEIQGADVASASHFGMFELESAADDKSGSLKLDESSMGFHDFRKEFVEIDRDRMFFGDDNPPKDVIRVEVPFGPTPRAASAISLRGKLQLKRVETIDVLVPAAVGDVKHEQLDKLGLKIKIVKPGQDTGFSYEVSGKMDALNAAALVDAQGEPLKTNGMSSFGDGEMSHRDVYFENAPPSDAKLKLALVVKAQNVPVSFDLKSIKLP